MQLISETARPGGPATPKFAPSRLTPDGASLADPRSFLHGPPMQRFAELRTAAPVAWCQDSPDGSGFWALTRYEDVMAVNADPETFSSQRGGSGSAAAKLTPFCINAATAGFDCSHFVTSRCAASTL